MPALVSLSVTRKHKSSVLGYYLADVLRPACFACNLSQRRNRARCLPSS